MSDDTTSAATPPNGLTRRTFAGLAGAAVLADPVARIAHAAGSDRLRVGLVGCGGRGTGAAMQAINADPGAVLWAFADPFADRIESSAGIIRRSVDEKAAKDPSFAQRFDCAPDRRFTGLDGYRQLVDVCDVVLIAAPPGFRPEHLRAAVEAGRHVFCEKPMAVDSTGLRSLRETAAMATRKGLSLVSGFCWRYSPAQRDIYARIRDGAIGPVRTVYSSYNAIGFKGDTPRKPDWTDMEYVLRNWQYYTWLSGDHIVEQAVHSLDRMAWAMGDEPPQRVTCTGGRELRTEKPDGNNIFDHFAACYEYSDGRLGYHMCRHYPGASTDVSVSVIGAKGVATVASAREKEQIVADGQTWRSDAPNKDKYQQEHDDLFAGIRAGKPVNDGEWMTTSTGLAIMARMSAYSGHPVTWDQLWESREDLVPKELSLSAPPPPSPIAVPGRTKIL